MILKYENGQMEFLEPFPALSVTNANFKKILKLASSGYNDVSQIKETLMSDFKSETNRIRTEYNAFRDTILAAQNASGTSEKNYAALGKRLTARQKSDIAKIKKLEKFEKILCEVL